MYIISHYQLNPLDSSTTEIENAENGKRAIKQAKRIGYQKPLLAKAQNADKDTRSA